MPGLKHDKRQLPRIAPVDQLSLKQKMELVNALAARACRA
jgi:hypothetical protein